MNKKLLRIFTLFFLFYISQLNVLAFSEINLKQEDLLKTSPKTYEATSYSELIKYLQSGIIKGGEVSVAYNGDEEITPLVVWNSVYETYIDTNEDYVKNFVDPNRLYMYFNEITRTENDIVEKYKRYYFNFININYSYLSNNQETEYINNKMDEIINSLDLKYLTTYEKVEKIHNWICDNFYYDFSMKNIKIYDGFDKGSFICSSYTSLAYNLLNRAGIETRILYGNAYELHNWNLVKMDDGLWYHLDITWNDSEGSKNYFLQGQSITNTHNIHSMLLSSIYKYYNIANSSYYYEAPIDPLISTDIKEFYYDEKEPIDIVIPGIIFNDATSLNVFLNDRKLNIDEYKVELDINTGTYNCTIFKSSLNALPKGINNIRLNFNDVRKLDFYFNIDITKINYPELTLDKNIYIDSPYYLYFENLSNEAKIKYISSDKQILKVTSNGKITPIKKGNATILCEIEQNGHIYKVNINFNVIKKKNLNKKYEKTIKVQKPENNPIIIIHKELTKGENFDFLIKNLEETSEVNYNLSNKKVIALNNNKITANKKGSSMIAIDIKQNNTTYTYKILVEVK